MMQSETSGQTLMEGGQQVEQLNAVIGSGSFGDPFDDPYGVRPELHELYSG